MNPKKELLWGLWVVGKDYGDSSWGEYRDYYRDPFPHSLLRTIQISRSSRRHALDESCSVGEVVLSEDCRYQFGSARATARQLSFQAGAPKASVPCQPACGHLARGGCEIVAFVFAVRLSLDSEAVGSSLPARGPSAIAAQQDRPRRSPEHMRSHRKEWQGVARDRHTHTHKTLRALAL